MLFNKVTEPDINYNLKQSIFGCFKICLEVIFIVKHAATFIALLLDHIFVAQLPEVPECVFLFY